MDNQPRLNYFLSLPEELRIRILRELKANDLLACQKVCRSLQATVLDPYLQYVAALDAAGMKDGPPGGAAFPERSKALAQYEATWITGQFPWGFHALPSQVGEMHPYRWNGGVFVHFPSPDSGHARLAIHRPASFSSGISEKTWNIDLSAFVSCTEGINEVQDIVAYAVDTEQALLAVVLAPQENYWLPRCYLLSTFSVAELHPLAACNPLVAHRAPGLSDSGVWWPIYSTVSIVDDLVGLHICLGSVSQLRVFNWRTGQFLWRSIRLNGHSRQLDFLVDTRYVARFAVSGISLYDITSDGDPYKPNRGLVGHLELPKLARQPSPDSPEIDIQRPALTSSDSFAHFECDPERTVFTLFTKTIGTPPTKGVLIFVPITTILDFARSTLRSSLLPSPRVPWDDWGAHGARLILMSPDCQFYRSTSLGSHVVIRVCDGRHQSPHLGDDALFLFDVRAEIGKPSIHLAEGMADLLETSDCLIAPELLESPVSSTLPYRVVGVWCSELWLTGYDWGEWIYPLCDGLLHVAPSRDEVLE
ncbi:hypothetical protein L226DRAFT_571143 [Lentinus tigrinus ALCF2SS1-7]|uniref:F-box domain-containing protein n=1 Tax=Lentinus tigrinus ALCF2SS1-6 TaxID=1328759 RepID=A0A5C2S8E4_9APHY|nr:hypothetical protein L227DRAFT_653638 [Lentinus tigrinus ALCF2SS1-6]RPD74868.1 hypothetical protein L226DRAFT_571143 [Lentinus tigrinus ALCF2SS1-7]